MTRLLLAFVVAAMAVGVTWVGEAAESRGLTVKLRESEGANASFLPDVELYHASYALVIGIDSYSAGWPRLSNAGRDARQVAALLESKGFEVTLKIDLSSADLEQTLREFFIIKGSDSEARLFVWFAGHGHTEGGEGFLVPYDAPRPDAGAQFKLMALPMRRFGEYVRLAESKHVFTVFDSCFAGTVFDTQRALPPAAITQATTQPVRQFLTSGDAEQAVSDDGMFRDLFVRALLGEENADANRDGYLTASELGMFLSNRVTNLTSSRQTPRYGKLRDRNYDRGDFVFQVSGGETVGSGSASASTSAAPSPSQTDAAFDLAFWDAIKNSTAPEDYQAYLEQFPEGRFASLARVRARSQPARIEVEELDGAFVAVTNTNVRAGPTTNADKSGFLRRGTRVAVTGRVTDAPWYRIEMEGGGTGYVFKDLLKPDEPAVAAVDPKVPEPAKPSPSQPAETFSQMVDRLQASVVGIVVDRNPQGGGAASRGVGSGYLIDAAGYVLTNHHVIDGADRVIVRLSNGTSRMAQIVGVDSRTGTALLRIESTGPALPYLSVGEAALPQIGEAVFVLGRSEGGGATVTRGFISSLGHGLGNSFIIIDRVIAPGNSGGPMFNMQGAAIGIALHMVQPEEPGSRQTEGFAIPLTSVTQVIADLREFGKARRAFLGVHIQTVTEEIAESLGFKGTKGALVAQATPGGPADAAGFQAGDVILSFDGEELSEMPQLPPLVAAKRPGSRAKVRYWREGQMRSLTVTLGDLDDAQALAAAAPRPRQRTGAAQPSDPFREFFGDSPTRGKSMRVLGMTLAVIDAAARQRHGLASHIRGVVVAEVTEGGPASEKGIQVGDVVVEVSQEDAASPAQVVKLVDAERNAGRKSVLLLVEGQGRLRFEAVRIDDG